MLNSCNSITYLYRYILVLYVMYIIIFTIIPGFVEVPLWQVSWRSCRSRLNRIAISTEPKKDVNACLDFIYTVVKGHILASACEVLGVSGLDGVPTIPPGLKTASKTEQLSFIGDISQKVVNRCTLVESAFMATDDVHEAEDDPSLLTDEETESDGVYNYARVLCHYGALIMDFRDAWAEGDGERVIRCWKLFMPHFKCFVESAFMATDDVHEAEDDPSLLTDEETESDGVYNYARVLCHYGALIMDFRDAWAEGDGERVIRCWKLFMPHFKCFGRTKYSLEALRIQMQVNATLSLNLAHQVMWNRFVNVRGGLGRNIPCDLFNEHVNKLMKRFIVNMGPNLTETSLQRAARSVTALHNIAEKFDAQSGVPRTNCAHSTITDEKDVRIVLDTVLKNKLLDELGLRSHRAFPNMKLNPLFKWDMKKTKEWMKKTDFLKYKRKFRGEEPEL